MLKALHHGGQSPSLRCHALSFWQNVRRHALLVLLLFFNLLGLKSQPAAAPSDTLTAALVTCAPGTKVWAYYGHTALLLSNQQQHTAVVFNYGLFDFRAPHFTWRFVLGKTDYMVGAAPLDHFLEDYRRRGSEVRIAVLNLSQDEVHRLYAAIKAQCDEPDWTYHYDYFYDNCATRVRDQIEACINGQVIYPEEEGTTTLRQIIHRYSEPYKWSTFGQDLLIGAEADLPAPRQLQEFAPEVLEQHLLAAQIEDISGERRPLVLQTAPIVPAPSVAPAFRKGFPLSPLTCSMIVLIAAIGLSLYDHHSRRLSWWFDLLLLLLQGIAGCIITFMFFFSVQPTVSTNGLIFLLNPLPLLCLFFTIRSEHACRPSLYHRVAVVWILLFFLGSFLLSRQYFSLPLYLLALSLWIRSLLCSGLLPHTFLRK